MANRKAPLKIDSWASRNRTAVVVAGITVIGTLATAIVSNWGALFVDRETPSAHALAVGIVSQNYRRAFALNFTTRFARRDEYEAVSKSISESHSAVQKSIIEFTDVGDKAAAATLRTMLEKLAALDACFEEMRPLIGDEVRLDATGPAHLTNLVHEAEELRREYVQELKRFAQQTEVALPSVPVGQP
jgi:hypothetical protein